jgi:prefoldin subunit 5
MASLKAEIEDLKKANAILQKLITNRDAEIDRLRARIEELNKRDYIISSNRNSFM